MRKIIFICFLLLSNCMTAMVNRTQMAKHESAPQRMPASDVNPNAIHIFATTDIHGYILPQPDGSGGIDLMSGFMQIARKADPETLLLDAGDLFQGTIISNTAEGVPVVKWMNYAHYTATAIGNHDFDFGPNGKMSQVRRKGQDPLGALKKRMKQAEFKMLSANICATNEDPKKCEDADNYSVAQFTKPYIIPTVHGVKVGIIGLTTTTTPSTTMPANVEQLKFMPLEKALMHFVPQMKAEGAETIIVVAHEGSACREGKCDFKDRMFAAIDALSPEVRKQIPLMVAGHTHNVVDIDYNGVHIMINGAYNKGFGYITLERKDGGFAVTATQSVKNVPGKFLDQDVQADPQALALIADDAKVANDTASKVIGQLATEVSADIANAENTLGDLVTDALRFCSRSGCQGKPADIAFQNATGLRIKKLPKGDITFGQLFDLLPFDNAVATVQMKGSQVHDLLDLFYLYNHGKLNDVSGLKIHYAAAQPEIRKLTNSGGESKDVPRAVISITKADGSPFDENATYKVIMADFLAEGGGGTAFLLDNFTPEPKINHSRQLRDALIEYFKSHNEPLDYSKLGGGRLIPETK